MRDTYQQLPPSNPNNEHLHHIFTLLTSWEQVKKYLIDYLPVCDQQGNAASAAAATTTTTTAGDNSLTGSIVHEELQQRLNLPVHQVTTRDSTISTLRYLFFHMRCGIFVKIVGGRLRMFVPFVNQDYENTWGHQLQLCGGRGVREYYDSKRSVNARGFRRENVLQDKSKWWANGNIICNEHCRPGQPQHKSQLWGDQYFLELRDMLETTCHHRDVPDCEFFINKRDYPQLKAQTDTSHKLTEPYGFLFDRDDKDPAAGVPLEREVHPTYAPICSFYVSRRFADLPFPSTEDWLAATGEVFPSPTPWVEKDRRTGGERMGKIKDLFTRENFSRFRKEWGEKVNTAFFRGSATGGGTTIATNQRLHLSDINYRWSKDPLLSGTSADGVPYLDAGVVGWNARCKKVAGHPMTHLDPSMLEFTLAGRTEMYEQGVYKYLIYVEGHCAANRYAFMMRMGSVIIKVESMCVADQLWFFPLLNGDVTDPLCDHVPVKADLSDLQERLQWCRDNDARCQQIAARTQEVYDRYVSKDGIMDYMQLLMSEIHQHYAAPPSWWRYPGGPVDRPFMGDNATVVFSERMQKRRREQQERHYQQPYHHQQQQQQQQPQPQQRAVVQQQQRGMNRRRVKRRRT